MRFSNWQNRPIHNTLGIVWLGILAITAILLLWAWLGKHIHIETDIFKLLPKGQYSAQVHDANQRVNQLINQKLFVLLEASSEEHLAQASAYTLAHSKQSALWQGSKPVLDTDALGKVLFAHRAGLLSEQDRQLLQAGDDQALTEQALSQLFSPGLPLNAELLNKDPLLFFPRYVMEKAAGVGNSNADIQLVDGWPSTRQQGKHYRLLILSLAKSPFDIDYQSQTGQWLQDLKQQLAQRYQVKTYSTGALMFATAGTQSARQEVSTIGVGSTIGLILLVWFGFRSFRPLLTEFAAVSAGCLMALAVTHLLFEQVHLMTLVFGASLIGVSVDFSFYYLSTQAAQRQLKSSIVMGRMLPSLAMGLLTTVAAYLCLSLTPFPGLKQIAVFSMTGLIAAWVTSVLLLPRLPALDNSGAVRRLRWLIQARQWFLAHRQYQVLLVVVVLMVGAVGFSQIQVDDQVQSLQSRNADIAVQDDKIKQLFHQQQSSQYFVVYGQDEAQLAAREQQLLQQLRGLVSAGKLQSYQALGEWLPSTAQQQQNRQWQQQIPAATLQGYADVSGISLHTLGDWQAALATQPLLGLSHLGDTPFYDLQLSPQQRIVLLGPVQDMAALQAIKLQGVTFVDPVNDLSSLFQQYRVQAQYMIVAGLLVLSLILGMVYGFKNLLNLMLPVCLALLSTFAVQALLGVPLNLFGVMAAFLILGIGVDYAIFYQQDEAGHAYVTSAMFLCMLATILGFGLLALSATQAIHAFGLTVLLGVIFSFIFASVLTRGKLMTNTAASIDR